MSGLVLKISIEGSHPPVWRRVLIPENINFHDLHKIIQVIFGWSDMHLHDFTTPKREMIISNDQADDGIFWGNNEGDDENDLVVDYVLAVFKWIRYTYDFGDDWRHKIVFEKIDPNYRERFAVVLKAKGDNYAEDSGGVYRYADEDDEEDMLGIPFDIDDVNAILRREEIPVRENLIDDEDYDDEDYDDEDYDDEDYDDKLTDSFSDLADMFFKIFQMDTIMDNMQKTSKEVSRKTTRPSGMKKRIAEWSAFADAQKDRYGDNLVRTDRKISVVKVLELLDSTEVSDYRKYLALSQKKITKKAGIEEVSSFLMEHTEYLLYVLDADSFRKLKAVYLQKPGVIRQSSMKECIGVGMAVGLLEGDFTYEGAWEITFTDLAERFFACADAKTVKKIHTQLDEVMKLVFPLLQVYGVIEVNELHKLCHEEYQIHMDLDAFRRIIYWHGRMSQKYYTSVSGISREDIVSFEKDSFAENLLTRELWLKELPYRTLEKDELRLIREGFNAVYECWDEVIQYLEVDSERTQNEISHLMTDLAYKVQNGMDIQSFIKEMRAYREPQNLSTWVRLWYLSAWVMSETPIFGLKGFTRADFWEEDLPIPIELKLNRGENKNPVQKTTHLYEMSNEIQEKLARAIFTYDYDENSTVSMEKVSQDVGGRNEEIQVLLITRYMAERQFEKAKKLLDKLMKTTSKNNQERLKEQFGQIFDLEMLDDSEDDDPFEALTGADRQEKKIVPFRREEKKIGRNDPCPCGSGRKYKHCCGRK